MIEIKYIKKEGFYIHNLETKGVLYIGVENMKPSTTVHMSIIAGNNVDKKDFVINQAGLYESHEIYVTGSKIGQDLVYKISTFDNINMLFLGHYHGKFRRIIEMFDRADIYLLGKTDLQNTKEEIDDLSSQFDSGFVVVGGPFDVQELDKITNVSFVEVKKLKIKDKIDDKKEFYFLSS